MTNGLTLRWIASELGESERRVRNWIYKDPRFPRPGQGQGYYSAAAYHRLRAIQRGYQAWPRGPIESILALIDGQ